jgi:hypothetical protein
VLSHGGIPPDDADSRTVRQILSLQQIKASLGYLRGHIVVELQDIDNLAMTKLVGKEDIEVIVSHELIGRLMLLAARSPWIAPVLSSLMGFVGAEFYFKEWPQLVGSTFGAVCYRFDDAIPIGIKRASNGSILINPSDDCVVEGGDLILVLAEDDNSYEVNEREMDAQDDTGALAESCSGRRVVRVDPPAEKILFCGWRRDMADMIKELDFDVQPGSELWLFNSVPMQDRELKMLDKGNKAPLRLKNLKTRHAVGNPTSRRQLLCLQEVSDGTGEDGLEIGEPTGRRVVLSYFSSILILSDSTKGDMERDMEASDSRSLATTLGIQDIQQASMLRLSALGKDVELFPPISEILDIRTARQMHLISQGYVMSNHLVASYLAMVSEDRSVNKIYAELLSCRGNEIQIHKVGEYVDLGQGADLSFWEMSRVVRVFKDLLIGYIEHTHGAKKRQRGLSLSDKTSHDNHVKLNPERKQERRRWHPEDQLVLISLCRRARIKAERHVLRLRAEEEMRQTTISAGELKIHGWIKKLGVGPHRAFEMDDERSWRDRLAFVTDGAMYYVSEKKRGDRELVCRINDIWHMEVGNGWPPGHYTFKLYMAPKNMVVDRGSFSLEALPSRVFSAPTAEECRAWISVLSNGGDVDLEAGGRVFCASPVRLSSCANISLPLVGESVHQAGPPRSRPASPSARAGKLPGSPVVSRPAAATAARGQRWLSGSPEQPAARAAPLMSPMKWQAQADRAADGALPGEATEASADVDVRHGCDDAHGDGDGEGDNEASVESKGTPARGDEDGTARAVAAAVNGRPSVTSPTAAR